MIHKGRFQMQKTYEIFHMTVFRQDWTLLAVGCPNFDKTVFGGSWRNWWNFFWWYMKKLTSSPLEQFLGIRVCQKRQKCKNSEKLGFWWNFGYISKMVRSIFMIFWHKTPLTINKRLAKKNFKIFFHFWETTNFAKIEISQKPVFLFFWNSKLKLPKA